LPKNSDGTIQYRRLRSEEPIAGVELLERGQLAPSPSAREFGERCKLPSGEVRPLQAAYSATLLNVIITLSATLLLLRKQLQKSLSLTAIRVAPTPLGQKLHELGLSTSTAGFNPLTPPSTCTLLDGDVIPLKEHRTAAHLSLILNN